MTTDRRLVAAATALLDSQGEKAVTLRAVGHACGLSHNAPYKHFASRDALLAAVAITDFGWLKGAFHAVGQSTIKPTRKLKDALAVVVDYSVEHPARYHLLFHHPGIAAQKGELEQAALAAFGELLAIVEECKAAQELPPTPKTNLAGLLFATMHGLIALEASGSMHAEKGLTRVSHSLELLVQLLSPHQRKSPVGNKPQRR